MMCSCRSKSKVVFLEVSATSRRWRGGGTAQLLPAMARRRLLSRVPRRTRDACASRRWSGNRQRGEVQDNYSYGARTSGRSPGGGDTSKQFYVACSPR